MNREIFNYLLGRILLSFPRRKYSLWRVKWLCLYLMRYCRDGNKCRQEVYNLDKGDFLCDKSMVNIKQMVTLQSLMSPQSLTMNHWYYSGPRTSYCRRYWQPTKSFARTPVAKPNKSIHLVR